MNQNPVTEDQIKAVTVKITKDYESKGSNATAVFFYMHETEVGHGVIPAPRLNGPQMGSGKMPIKNQIIKLPTILKSM